MAAKWQPQPKEVIASWLKACKIAKGLTDWELDFLGNIAEQFTLRGYLSEAQQNVLERIYTEKTK